MTRPNKKNVSTFNSDLHFKKCHCEASGRPFMVGRLYQRKSPKVRIKIPAAKILCSLSPLAEEIDFDPADSQAKDKRTRNGSKARKRDAEH